MSHMHARMLRQPELYLLRQMHVMASHRLHSHDRRNTERVRQPRMFDILLCIVCLGLSSCHLLNYPRLRCLRCLCLLVEPNTIHRQMVGFRRVNRVRVSRVRVRVNVRIRIRVMFSFSGQSLFSLNSPMPVCLHSRYWHE